MKTYSRHDFTREERAARAKVAISAAFASKEQAFLDFVLDHYVRATLRRPRRVESRSGGPMKAAVTLLGLFLSISVYAGSQDQTLRLG